MKLSKKYKISLFFIIGIFLTLLIFFKFSDEQKSKNFVNKYIWPYTPIKIQVIVKTIFKEKYLNQFLNDYNVKFIPETQTTNLDFKKYKLDFIIGTTGIYNKNTTRKTFFIEKINNHIWIIDIKGTVYELDNLKDIKVNKSIRNYKKIPNNLKSYQVLDTFSDSDKIYISYVSKKDDCFQFNISSAKINDQNLEFDNFFSPRECMKSTIQGGRIQKYILNDTIGLIFTIGDSSTPDFIGGDAQDDKSIYGKIIFKSLTDVDKEKYILFSKGHRNPQGLYVDEFNNILSTEHGPRGGDEINKIIFNKNYGWPEASYGESYFSKDIEYKKNHEENGFYEPIFSFIPSIGISEIILVPNEFSKKWENNYLVASLNDKSVYRVKFSKNFNKILYIEKIFIGERIRDLKFDKESNKILLALETHGNLATLENNKK